MKLIINADDFGYSKAINYGILEGFKGGILTSTTLMTNMPGASHAFELMGGYRDLLRVGIHLTLGAGRPVSTDVPSLVDAKGFFLKKDKILKEPPLEEIEREFHAQFQRFLSSGFKPTHIDTHYHTHRNGGILSILLKLAEQHHLPIRCFDGEVLTQKGYPHIKTVQRFVEDFYGDVSMELFEELLSNNSTHERVEIMCHPGYIDTTLLENSSYNLQRAKELSIITDPKARQIIEKYSIQLVDYSAL